MPFSCESTSCSSLAHTLPVPSSHLGGGKAKSRKTISEDSVQPPLRILVAEDESISRMFISKVLMKFGHEVRSVKNGQEVLEILAENEKFDVLLTDIQMPLLNGVELTHIIRSDTKYRHQAGIPIIAMTAYAISGDREEFLKAGMDDYLPKPIDAKLLAIMIEQVMPKPQ